MRLIVCLYFCYSCCPLCPPSLQQAFPPALLTRPAYAPLALFLCKYRVRAGRDPPRGLQEALSLLINHLKTHLSYMQSTCWPRSTAPASRSPAPSRPRAGPWPCWGATWSALRRRAPERPSPTCCPAWCTSMRRWVRCCCCAAAAAPAPLLPAACLPAMHGAAPSRPVRACVKAGVALGLTALLPRRPSRPPRLAPLTSLPAAAAIPSAGAPVARRWPHRAVPGTHS